MAKRSTKSKARTVKKKSGFNKKEFSLFVLIFALVGAFTLWVSFAAGTTTCTQNTPGVIVDNTYAWATPGSWGLPGQQLKYAARVINYDTGCAMDSFTLNVSAPAGFSVSIPTTTVSLKAGTTSSYIYIPITSPNPVTNGDYPLTFSVTRAGAVAASATTTNYYKVYSSDTVAPTTYWPNPGDGSTISRKGHSTYNVLVSANDDHAVKSIDIYLDGVYMNTTNCDDISYTCQALYKWSLHGVSGAHTATFKAYDWVGNVGTMTTSFTVN